MQTTDLAPTILNLLGLEVPREVMGSDIFDKNYKWYAICPENSWITNEAYVKNGIVIWNKGMTTDDIEKMNSYVLEISLSIS